MAATAEALRGIPSSGHLKKTEGNILDQQNGHRPLSIEDHLGLIGWVIGYFTRSSPKFGLTSDDLMQVGALEFLKKAPLYDPEQGTVAAYMVPRIRGAIKKEFRDRGFLVDLPRSIKENMTKVSDVIVKLEETLGRTPSDEEVGKEVRLEPPLVHNIRVAIKNYVADPFTLVDIEDQDETAPGVINVSKLAAPDNGKDSFEAVLDRLILQNALAELEPREKQIIAMRFGFNSESREMTQREIADELGISQMHVSRLLKEIIQTLRGFFEEGQVSPLAEVV